MLRLSKKADYALIAMKHLAHKDAGATSTCAREIAEQYDIPLELMAKVLQRLVRAGLLVSTQGTRGGYTLSRPSSAISVADVIRAVALFSRCQLPAVEAELARFHRRYDPVLPALRRAADNHADPTRAFALLDRSTQGVLGLDPRVERHVRRAFSDRELAHQLSVVRGLAAEERRATSIGRDEAAAAPLLAWVGQELAVARAFAEERTGELAAVRLRRELDAVASLVRTAEDFIEQVAAKPSETGEPKKVRLADGSVVDLASWLRGQIGR